MWKFIKRLWQKKTAPTQKKKPYVSEPIYNKKVVEFHPFFWKEPEEWIGSWLSISKMCGYDYCAMITANPNCHSILAADLLTLNLADVYPVDPPLWEIIQVHGTPIGYLPERGIIRMVWKDESGRKEVHEVNVATIYNDLVAADIIAP